MCICAHTWEVGRDETEERWGVETEEDGLIRQIEQNVKKFVGCWYKVWGVPCTILAAFLYAWNYIKIQQYTKNYKKLSKIARRTNTSPPGNSNDKQYQNFDQVLNSYLKE